MLNLKQWKNKYKVNDRLCALVALFVYVFTDALRDGMIDAGWWKRHIFKWISFLIAVGFFIWVSGINLLNLFWVAPVCWLTWQGGLWLTGKRWPSMWIVWIKELFKKKQVK